MTALAAAALAFPASTLWAQAWPNKPVTIVVPFPPGGGTDAFARPLFAAMSKNSGKQFLIDNKGGAGGTLGAGIASRAAPDGYTFFMGAVHHAIAPSMYPKLDYNIETDFIPVGLVSSVPQVVVVNPSKVQANTLGEFLAFARANPGKLNYGSAGNGTSHHLAGELFKLQSKTFITHIPYRGAGPALQDLIAGQVDVMFDGLEFGLIALHLRPVQLLGRLLLLGDGKGGFRAMPGAPSALSAASSGIRVLGDQRGAAAADYDGDGRVDGRLLADLGGECRRVHARRTRRGAHVAPRRRVHFHAARRRAARRRAESRRPGAVHAGDGV